MKKDVISAVVPDGGSTEELRGQPSNGVGQLSKGEKVKSVSAEEGNKETLASSANNDLKQHDVTLRTLRTLRTIGLAWVLTWTMDSLVKLEWPEDEAFMQL